MKGEQSQSSQIIVMNAVPATSPDSMANENEEIQLLPSNSAWKCYWKRCMFLAMLVLCSAMLGYEINAQGQDVIHYDSEKVYKTGDLSFTMFCPISATKYVVQKPSPTHDQQDIVQQQENEDLRRRLYTYEYPRQNIYVDPTQEKNHDPTRTYKIEARSINYSHSVMDGYGNWVNIVQPALFYCGLMSDFLDNCTKTYFACSSPGALFDISTRENVDIVWINNLTSSLVPNDGFSSNFTSSCLSQNHNPTPDYCYIMTKTDKNSAVTFANPTDGLSISSPVMNHTRILPGNWPMTVHVHGAEVRPTFDGHPLSWINNGGQNGLYGIGTYSLDNKCYYKHFDGNDDIDQKGRRSYLPPPEILSLDPTKALNNKTNRYPNRQNPGNLWYHDHSMRLTSFNVKNGLAGVYLLRDPEVEKVINVPRENQRFVLISATNLTTSFKLNDFRANVTYRFRFLNSVALGFGRSMRFSFSYNNCSANDTREFFSIIGADSSLFHESIDHQQSFVIHNAERIELLIRFDNPDETSFSICADNNQDDIFHNRTDFQNHSGHSNSKRLLTTDYDSFSVKGIKINQQKQQKKDSYRDIIDNIKLNVPYTDLSTLKDSQIAVTRFRPLIYLNPTMTISGRVDFHKGQSENPTMGTVEDWFLINTISFVGHPIHVHLINFQVIREYDLLTTSSGCAIYELDFLLDALLNITQHQHDHNTTRLKEGSFYNKNNRSGGVNYTFVCNQTVNFGYSQLIRKALSNVHLENNITDKKSGLDLFTIATTKQDIQDLTDAGVNFTQSTVIYKYVLNREGHPSKYPYYSRWKDTAFIEPMKVLQYRIRWAKSNFTQQDRKTGNYFHIPSDQLREFPGYVYHCHILNHEDNEMMRPIMLQMPPEGKLDKNTTCNDDPKAYDWNQKYKCINSRCMPKQADVHY